MLVQEWYRGQSIASRSVAPNAKRTGLACLVDLPVRSTANNEITMLSTVDVLINYKITCLVISHDCRQSGKVRKYLYLRDSAQYMFYNETSRNTTFIKNSILLGTRYQTLEEVKVVAHTPIRSDYIIDKTSPPNSVMNHGTRSECCSDAALAILFCSHNIIQLANSKGTSCRHADLQMPIKANI